MLKSLLKVAKKLISIAKSPEPGLLVPAISSRSQYYVLKEHMRENMMSHGQTVKADLNCVRLSPNIENEGIPSKKQAIIYFCPLTCIDIKEQLKEGDGKWLPDDVKLVNPRGPEGRKIDDSNLYSLKNVILSSNGKINIEFTPETTWELQQGW